jgi:hypothetical protein
MERDTHVLEELRHAAAALGPQGEQPGEGAHVRLPFPLVALPRVLRQFVKDAADAIGVPPECVATPAIATCATAIGNTCRIRLGSTWTEPSVIWAVTLMESGSLKTPAYEAAIEPLVAEQEVLEAKYQRSLADFHTARERFDADASLWKNATASNANEDPPARPVEPKRVDLFTCDCTVEALGMLFNRNPRGLAFTRDELSTFFASFGAYKGGRGGDEGTYLQFFNAGKIKVDRASGKQLFARTAPLSIFGTCQPTVFANAIGALGKNANQIENGLAARFLIAAPDSTPKVYRDTPGYDARPYARMIAELLRIDLPRNADGFVEPAIISMLPDAMARFIEFVNEHGRQTHSIKTPALRYHYKKLDGVAGRLALIFYLCDAATQNLDGASGKGVQERHILSGIALARWYGREAQCVYGGVKVTAADSERKQLLQDIENNGGMITLTELRQLRSRWRAPMVAENALKALDRDGLGRLILDETNPHGGRPVLRFRLFDENDKIDLPGTEFPETTCDPPEGY